MGGRLQTREALGPLVGLLARKSAPEPVLAVPPRDPNSSVARVKPSMKSIARVGAHLTLRECVIGNDASGVSLTDKLCVFGFVRA